MSNNAQTINPEEPPPTPPSTPPNAEKRIEEVEDKRWPGLINSVCHSAFERFHIFREERDAQNNRNREQLMDEVEQRVLRKFQAQLDDEAREDAKLDFEDYLASWKDERDRKKKRNTLSREQVDEKVLDMVDEVKFREGLMRKKNESHEDWQKRMHDLEVQVNEAWNNNSERILMREPRYVDGLPASMIVKPPLFRPHVRQVDTGREACLQCLTKGLQCSRTLTRWAGKPGDAGENPCDRCVRNGERCLIYTDGKPGEWGFAPGAEPEMEPPERKGKKDKRAESAEEELLMGGGMQKVEGFALPKKDDNDKLRERLRKKAGAQLLEEKDN